MSNKPKEWEKMKSKWHNISIPSASFEELQEIQDLIPIRISIPQTIEYLIKLGQKTIKSELHNGNTDRIPK